MSPARDVVEQRREVLRLVHDSFLHSLDGMPPERLWERPGLGFPIARLVQHVRAAIVFWLWREGDDLPPAIERGAPLDTILDSFKQVCGRLDDILASASDADLEAAWSSTAPRRFGVVRPGGSSITLGFITKRLMQHALYHQAQVDYIRAMGEEGWGEGRTYWEEAADAVSACP
jgi:hypothetical protein